MFEDFHSNDYFSAVSVVAKSAEAKVGEMCRGTNLLESFAFGINIFPFAFPLALLAFKARLV